MRFSFRFEYLTLLFGLFLWIVELAKNQTTLLFRSVMFVETCPMRRCSRLRCQRLFILFGCVHHYQMYVPITFVGLPLDFRKKGTEVGWKKSVGWIVAFEKQTRGTLTVCCRKCKVCSKKWCFCFILSTSDLSFSFGMHIGTTCLFCVRRGKQIERWENRGKHCSQIKMLLKDKEMDRWA